MTKQEYADYESAFAEFMEREGIRNLSTGRIRCERCNVMLDDGTCPKCNKPVEAMSCDPHFSWSPCECCQRPLGGDRYDASGYNPTTKEIQEYTICTDCMYYAEYGKLDDTTMMEIEDSAE